MLTYYKIIELENYDIIIKKALAYVKTIDIAYNRKLGHASWYDLSTKELTIACPELAVALLKYDLKIVMAAAYVMYDSKHTSIHIDHYSAKARLNLPLLNCDNTYTNFYDSDGEIVKWINPDSGVVSYNTTGQPRFVDRVEMKQATVIRTKVFHTVDLPAGNPVPRITLTLGLSKDPVYMLE
jgi:hypothetical protein